ncbi:MAG: PmoA family protein [Verrucomicrobiales bacterium]|nr:PmoA family protein [Verrucomicrobiales bacterium]
MAQRAKQGGVNIEKRDGKLVIDIGAKPFAEYHYENVPRPFLYPLLGPNGEAMTRHWPMQNLPTEEHDHPHHRSLWFTHGDVNGLDFWSESGSACKIVHDEFLDIQSGAESGLITSKNTWASREGKVACTDVRRLRIYNRAANERLFDFEVTIKAVNGDVTFGDTKEGSMAVRLAESMRLTQPKGKAPGQGHIVNSEGIRDNATWGKRAKWCDYYGPVNGKTVGLAIFDHPSNPKHPTWWHVRDYGLFAANPFGVHDFEKKAPGTGNFTIPAGQSATFRYRFYLHEGDEKQAKVEQRYQEYVAEKLK